MPLNKNGVAATPAAVESKASTLPLAINTGGKEVDNETLGKISMHAYIAAVSSPGVLSFSQNQEQFDANVEKYAQLIIRKSLGR